MREARHQRRDPRAAEARRRVHPQRAFGRGPAAGNRFLHLADAVEDLRLWDAVAKIEGKPLFQLLVDRYGNGIAGRKIFVYAAGGYYYPGQDHNKLKDEMRSYIDRGYTVVKKKIGGASLDEDLRRIDSILAVPQDGQKLAVDANGRFDLDTAIQCAKALIGFEGKADLYAEMIKLAV